MLWLDLSLIIIAVALIAAILIQTRSAGMGGAFGGGAEGFHVRRGSENVLFRATLVLSFLFLLIVAAHLFVR